MKTQKLLMFFITAVLALTFVSAAITSLPTGVVLTQSSTSGTTTISGNTSALSATIIGSIIDDASVVITPGTSVSGQILTITASGSVNYDNLQVGRHYGGASANVSDAGNSTLVSLYYFKSFCEFGAVNDSQLELDISIDVDSEGEGDEETWYPRDIVEVEVDFDNNFDDLDDVYLELGLFDSEGNDIAGDLDWIDGDESQKLGDVDDGDDDSYIFKFYVPNDVDEGEYELIIKAYEDDNEEGLCIDYDTSGEYTQSIEISKEGDQDRLIYFENFEVSPATATCGSEVLVTATMYNIGEEKQEAVKANLYSALLGLDLSELYEKFDSDDKAEVEFRFVIPTNMTEGTYKLSLSALYDWDEDEDDDEEYDDVYFDEKSDPAKVSLTLDGKCSDSTDAGIKIDVVLSKDTPTAKAGKQVIVEATIENTGTGASNYEVSVSGVSDWADATIDDNDFTLAAGESKTIEIALDIDKDVKAGEKEFTIKTTYGDSSKEQAVIIDVEEGFSLGFGSIGTHFQDNWFIYTVILVDVILIAAIIIAVVRVAKRPSA